VSGPGVPSDPGEFGDPGGGDPAAGAGDPGAGTGDFGADAGGPGAGGSDPGIMEEFMAGFRRTPRGVSARFSSAQAGIVRTLVGQVADLVGGPGSSSAGQAEREGGGRERPDGDEMLSQDLASIFGSGGPTAPPEDPVLARLFPDAYGDDPEAAGDFRKYTEPGLRSGKVAAARTVLATLPDSGGRVRLSAGDAEAWLRALNDVRLALGVVLGITEDYEHELTGASVTDPRSAYLQVYDWLTYLQETLVRALR
jgi:Domain of unknown function (DUF2017)